MKRFMPLLLLGMGLWLGAAVAQTFITLDYPNGGGTQLNGIDGTNIVGTANSIPGGFLYNGSTFTGIADPLGTSGEPLAVSGSNIVGVYTDSEGIGHSYLYNGSTYTTLDPPYAQNNSAGVGSFPCGISGGYIVGTYRDAAHESHGYLYDGSTYTTIDDPLAGSNHAYTIQGTEPYGISGGTIVGGYVDASDVSHGFTYDILTNSFTTLDDPLSSGYYGTIATGISGNDIAGIFYNASGAHGFLYNGSTYTTLDDPLGVAQTEIMGISGNTIVGSYVDSSDLSEGFVATIPEPSTFALLSAGVLSLAAYVWRKRSLALAAKSTLPSETVSDADPTTILPMPSRWTQSTRRAA